MKKLLVGLGITGAAMVGAVVIYINKKNIDEKIKEANDEIDKKNGITKEELDAKVKDVNNGTDEEKAVKWEELTGILNKISKKISYVYNEDGSSHVDAKLANPRLNYVTYFGKRIKDLKSSILG